MPKDIDDDYFYGTGTINEELENFQVYEKGGELHLHDTRTDDVVRVSEDGSLRTEETESNVTLSDIERHGYDGLSPTHQPLAVTHNGVTYFVVVEQDVSNDLFRLKVGSYDEQTNEWGEVVEVDRSINDGHYQPALQVDDDGYLYLVYGARGEFTLQRSDMPESVHSWTDMGNIPGTRDYRQVVVVDNNLHVFSRDGGANDQAPLVRVTSTDRGETWDTETLVDVTDRAIYPYGHVVDGTEVHLLFSTRVDGTSGHDGIYHASYDVSTSDFVGSDGTVLSTPASRTDLEGVSSAVHDTATTQIGAGFDLTNGNPAVAFLAGSESSPESLKVSVWDGSQWSETVLDGSYPSRSQWAGSQLSLTADGDDVTVWEPGTMRSESEKNVARWSSTDGGSTWSDREVYRDFSWLYGGVDCLIPVRGEESSLEWVASEFSGLEDVDNFSRYLGFDGELREVEGWETLENRSDVKQRGDGRSPARMFGTPQDLTSERSLGTFYHNDSGSPKVVYTTIEATADGTSMTISGDVAESETYVGMAQRELASATTEELLSITLIVPPDHHYRVQAWGDDTNITLADWYEQ